MWMEVVVACSVSLAEGMAAELVLEVSAASGGVQIRKNQVVFWVQPEDMAATLSEVENCLTKLAALGWDTGPEKVSAGSEAPEEEWRDAWKKYFHVTRLTRQIVVVPSWETYEAMAVDLPIHLDPGQAFGTGAHASTQLVLTSMQAMADSGYVPDTVFDLGTGSGILAIAAAKFWPQCTIVATDIDPLSISATLENGANNNVQDQIEVSTTELNCVEGQFPLILANLQAHILRGLVHDLLPRLAQGGDLLLSGILHAQIQPLVDFFCSEGTLEVVSITNSELNPDWSSAHLRDCSQQQDSE